MMDNHDEMLPEHRLVMKELMEVDIYTKYIDIPSRRFEDLPPTRKTITRNMETPFLPFRCHIPKTRMGQTPTMIILFSLYKEISRNN